MSKPVSGGATAGLVPVRRPRTMQSERAALAAAHTVLLAGLQTGQPAFLRDRYACLAAILEMVEDEGWVLQAVDRQRVLNVLSGFVMASEVGGVGHFTLIELASRELRHDLDAYQVFRQIRAGAARRYSPHDTDRDHWLEQRREALQLQMRLRRARDQHHAGGMWRRWRSLLNF